jgi:uncharacterized protein YtpQ (UPF0354 family)
MFSMLKKKPSPEAPIVIVPSIKHVNFLEAAAKIPGMEASRMPLAEPLAGDLLVTYSIDRGDRYEFVSEAAVEQYKLQKHDLRSLAKINALPALSKSKTRSDGTVHELTADDNMTACSILFPELWEQIERQIGGEVIAAFPHRDAVLFARADSPTAIAALKKVISQINFSDRHSLSQLLYCRVNAAWRPFES